MVNYTLVLTYKFWKKEWPTLNNSSKPLTLNILNTEGISIVSERKTLTGFENEEFNIVLN